MHKNTTIILIGPMGVGKSTIGEPLAAQLGFDYVGVDEICWDYFAEIGYDHERVKELVPPEKGFQGFIDYMKPFEAYAVERAVADHAENCVLDFGAGHTVHTDLQLFERVKRALAPFPNVVLLLPSADPAESITVLHERMLKRIEEIGEIYSWALDENKHFITHPSNGQLATVTVYTMDKTPAETCTDILERLDYF